MEYLVQLDLLVHEVSQDLLEIEDQLAFQEPQDLLDQQGNEGTKVDLEHQVIVVH